MMNQGNGGLYVETEVPPRVRRRRYPAEYKLRILDEADRCEGPGAIGALLRREGLYSSHLSAWRQAREEGALASLSKKRGRSKKKTAEAREIERLRRENAQLRAKLRRAETVIDVQKKVSEIMGLDLNQPENGEDD
jgi:transposase